jgi:hypothetical protein
MLRRVHVSRLPADLLHMHQVEAFADVLERELRRSAHVSDVFVRSTHALWAASPNPFVFTSRSPAVAPQLVGPVAGGVFPTEQPRFVAPEPVRSESMPGAASLPSDTAWRPEAAAPAQQRPSRILMARERRALRGLVALGGELEPNFTATDLRHAFRTLARQYHPDRHPQADAETRARLSRAFSEVAEHHRCLLAVVEPVGPVRH